ncbi:galactosamine-6-phosphate isomerase [Escherichia coli]|nr:galactosamine-6-phosphate isomerase [Escherichia coli]
MERGTASGGASLLKEFHPVQTLQQVENYTALSERASEYLLAVIRSKPDAVICLATGATPLLTVLIHLKYEKNREDIGLFGI